IVSLATEEHEHTENYHNEASVFKRMRQCKLQETFSCTDEKHTIQKQDIRHVGGGPSSCDGGGAIISSSSLSSSYTCHTHHDNGHEYHYVLDRCCINFCTTYPSVFIAVFLDTYPAWDRSLQKW